MVLIGPGPATTRNEEHTMQVRMTIFCQNAEDWDRYEAEERGENVDSRPAVSDRQVFLEDIELARSEASQSII